MGKDDAKPEDQHVRMMRMMWMRYGRDDDKGDTEPEDQHMEDDEKDNEDEIWVRMRIMMRLSLRIGIWRMMRKTMRMRCG